jgi:hypothetical protein
MELAGLEPASWVRSRRALALSLGYLWGFRGGGGPAAAPDFPPVSAYFGWDRAKEAPFWPDLGSSVASTAGGRSDHLLSDLVGAPTGFFVFSVGDPLAAAHPLRGASHAGTPRRV